jgi:hypothetical protein
LVGAAEVRVVAAAAAWADAAIVVVLADKVASLDVTTVGLGIAEEAWHGEVAAYFDAAEAVECLRVAQGYSPQASVMRVLVAWTMWPSLSLSSTCEQASMQASMQV